MAGDINNQQLTERLLDDLSKLMWTMVWDVANNDRWQLEPEEVYAELCLELVKLVKRYGSKPYIELKKLAVPSLRNRVHDLASACYMTNRRAEAKMLSLDGDPTHEGYDDDNLSLEEVQMGVSPKHYHRGFIQSDGMDDVFRMDEFCEGMSEDAKTLVREVLYPSERTAYFLWLTAQRKNTVSVRGFWTLTITPLIMTRSLGWTTDRLKIAWNEVSKSISGTTDFYGGLVGQEDGGGQQRRQH